MLDQVNGFEALYVSSGSGASGKGADPGPIGSVPGTAMRSVWGGSCRCFGLIGKDDEDSNVVDGDGGLSRCCRDASSDER